MEVAIDTESEKYKQLGGLVDYEIRRVARIDPKYDLIVELQTAGIDVPKKVPLREMFNYDVDYNVLSPFRVFEGHTFLFSASDDSPEKTESCTLSEMYSTDDWTITYGEFLQNLEDGFGIDEDNSYKPIAFVCTNIVGGEVITRIKNNYYADDIDIDEENTQCVNEDDVVDPGLFTSAVVTVLYVNNF